MRHELRKFVAPEYVYGEGARRLVGRYAVQLGAGRVLLVADPGVVDAGWAGEAEDSLREEGLEVVRFTGVSANPRDNEVAAGADIYREWGCDFIVAVGGGSPMDCAKGIGTAVAHDRDVLEFEGVDRLEAPIPPLVCVPTTGGTGADVSQFAIILDSARHVKVALVSKALVPDLALVDPEVLLTMDIELTRNTGMDALSHALEAYCSSAAWAMTDLHACAAISLLTQHLAVSVRNLDDLDERECVMRASLNAGLAFSNAGLGMVHAMAHAVGGLSDAAHGASNAALLIPVMEYNLPSIPSGRLGDLARALGVQEATVDAILESLAALVRDIGVEAGLAAFGVRKSMLGDLARLAFRDPCLATNPRIPTIEDIEAVYARAL